MAQKTRGGHVTYLVYFWIYVSRCSVLTEAGRRRAWRHFYGPRAANVGLANNGFPKTRQDSAVAKTHNCFWKNQQAWLLEGKHGVSVIATQQRGKINGHVNVNDNNLD